MIDNWLTIDKCRDCTVQLYRLNSTSVQTVQYKCTGCTVEAAEVGQYGPKISDLIKSI